MKKLITKSLLAGAALLTLTPTAALALPPDCDTECFADWASCSQRCAVPWAFRTTTCGQWVADYGDLYPENSCSPGVTGGEPQEEQASLTTQDDASAAVCSQADASDL